jgi:hypothetical protein
MLKMDFDFLEIGDKLKVIGRHKDRGKKVILSAIIYTMGWDSINHRMKVVESTKKLEGESRTNYVKVRFDDGTEKAMSRWSLSTSTPLREKKRPEEMIPKNDEYWWIKDKTDGEMIIGRCWIRKSTPDERWWFLFGNDVEARGENYEPISKIKEPKFK